MAIRARGGAVASRGQMPREGGPWARSLDAVAVVRPLVFSPSLSCLVLSTNCAGRKPQKLRHTRNKNVIIPVQKKKDFFGKKC